MEGAVADQLARRKEELYAKLKGAAGRLRYKQYELKEVRKALEQMRRECPVPARALRKQRNKLEFRISTESYTLARERELMKHISRVERELSKAEEVERLERKVRLIEGDIRNTEQEIGLIKKQIEETKEAMKAARAEADRRRKEQKKREWEARKREELMDEERKHMEELRPFLGKIEEGVELGHIAVIKKKNQG